MTMTIKKISRTTPLGKMLEMIVPLLENSETPAKLTAIAILMCVKSLANLGWSAHRNATMTVRVALRVLRAKSAIKAVSVDLN